MCNLKEANRPTLQFQGAQLTSLLCFFYLYQIILPGAKQLEWLIKSLNHSYTEHDEPTNLYTYWYVIYTPGISCTTDKLWWYLEVVCKRDQVNNSYFCQQQKCNWKLHFSTARYPPPTSSGWPHPISGHDCGISIFTQFADINRVHCLEVSPSRLEN